MVNKSSNICSYAFESLKSSAMWGSLSPRIKAPPHSLKVTEEKVTSVQKLCPTTHPEKARHNCSSELSGFQPGRLRQAGQGQPGPDKWERKCPRLTFQHCRQFPKSFPRKKVLPTGKREQLCYLILNGGEFLCGPLHLPQHC